MILLSDREHNGYSTVTSLAMPIPSMRIHLSETKFCQLPDGQTGHARCGGIVSGVILEL